MSYDAVKQRHGDETTVYFRGEPVVTFHGKWCGHTESDMMAFYICEALNGDASGLLSFVWAHDFARFDERITEGKDGHMLAYMLDAEMDTVRKKAFYLQDVLNMYRDKDCDVYEQRLVDMVATFAVELRMSARYAYAFKRALVEYDREQKQKGQLK